jgi:hypothetical protein
MDRNKALNGRNKRSVPPFSGLNGNLLLTQGSGCFAASTLGFVIPRFQRSTQTNCGIHGFSINSLFWRQARIEGLWGAIFGTAELANIANIPNPEL